MSNIKVIEITPDQVQAGKGQQKLPIKPVSFERKLLLRFKKSFAGLLLNASEARFRQMALLWNYLHHELWRFDGPPGTSIRFKNQTQALDYYRIVERTSQHYMQIARQYMEQLHPKGIPARAEFDTAMAKLAFEMWREENKLNSGDPHALLLNAHDDGVLEQAVTLASKHGREYKRRLKQKEEKKALTAGLSTAEKAAKSQQTSLEKLIDDDLPKVLNIASNLRAMRATECVVVTKSMMDKMQYTAKYLLYCVLFKQETSENSIMRFDEAMECAKSEGFEALEKKHEPAYYAVRNSVYDILAKFAALSPDNGHEA